MRADVIHEKFLRNCLIWIWALVLLAAQVAQGQATTSVLGNFS